MFFLAVDEGERNLLPRGWGVGKAGEVLTIGRRKNDETTSHPCRMSLKNVCWGRRRGCPLTNFTSTRKSYPLAPGRVSRTGGWIRVPSARLSRPKLSGRTNLYAGRTAMEACGASGLGLVVGSCRPRFSPSAQKAPPIAVKGSGRPSEARAIHRGTPGIGCPQDATNCNLGRSTEVSCGADVLLGSILRA